MSEGFVKRRRQRGPMVAFAAVAIVASIFAWLLLRPRNDLTLLSKPPYPMRAIPRAQIGVGPFVNFSIGGLKIEYPKANTVPQIFGALPGVSGVLVAESANENFASAAWTGTATWTVDGEPISAGPSFLGRDAEPGKLDLWVCPYVFGDAPKIAELRIRSATDDPIRLSLPPNRVPEPKIEARAVKVGAYTVRLQPKPWLSPSFPIRFAVTVEGGKKDDAFLMTISEAIDGGANLIYADGEPAELSLQNWDESWGILMQLQRVKKEKMPLSVTRAALTPPMQNIKFSREDHLVCDLTWNGNEPSYTGVSSYEIPGYAALRIQDYWPFGEFETRHTFGEHRHSYSSFSGLKDGDVIEALGYKAEEPLIQQDFVMTLPDPKVIPGTRAFEPGAR